MGTDGSSTAADVVSLPTDGVGSNLTSGPDGNIWVMGGNHIDRVPTNVTASNQITEFGQGYGGDVIVPGPDGNLWFTECKSLTCNNIAKITTAGVVTEYTAPNAGVFGIANGPGGELWFGEDTMIARMSTSGVVGAGDEFPVGGTSSNIPGVW